MVRARIRIAQLIEQDAVEPRPERYAGPIEACRAACGASFDPPEGKAARPSVRLPAGIFFPRLLLVRSKREPFWDMDAQDLAHCQIIVGASRCI
jgi:hypothetical protein